MSAKKPSKAATVVGIISLRKAKLLYRLECQCGTRYDSPVDERGHVKPCPNCRAGGRQ